MAKIKLPKDAGNKEGGVLTRLWHKIIRENNLEHALDTYVDQYVIKNDEFGGRVKTMANKTRSSIIKNITAREMTWRTFLDLVINYLDTKKVTLSITITFKNGDISTHSVVVNNKKDKVVK